MKRHQNLEVINWYKAVKQASSCVYCDHEGISKDDPRRELHHIVPQTKRDCVSNLIYPVPYNITTVAIEFMKVAPMHPDCHAELHRVERENPILFKQSYDMLHDPRYIGLIQKFRETVIDTMPQREQVLDYMFDRGFQL